MLRSGLIITTFLSFFSGNNFSPETTLFISGTEPSHYPSINTTVFEEDNLIINVPNTTLEINMANAFFGSCVKSAGDVNGDGYSDVIVGARQYANGETDEGAIYVFHGSPTGISNTPATIFESNQANAFLGRHVANAGDINGDGYGDIIAGAFNISLGESQEGAVFVLYGSAIGINTTSIDTLQSNQGNAAFGFWTSTAGDVNGDGYSDVIIGAPYFDNGTADEGTAFIFHGSASGITSTPAVILDHNVADGKFGWSVASAGDVNGDGYSDVIVGAPDGEMPAGNGYFAVYHGSASGINTVPVSEVTSSVTAALGLSVASAGDMNGDGYSDVIVGAPGDGDGKTFIFHGSASGINTVPVITLQLPVPSSPPFTAYYGFSVSSAGDVNGDGYSDIVISAAFFNNGQIGEGAFCTYYGSPTGVVDANNLIESNQVSAQMGFSVSSAGDVNGDGFSDLIIGAISYSNGQSAEGAAFIYHGFPDTLSTSYLARLDDADMTGANFGRSVASAGDVNGDGFSDVIVGADAFMDGANFNEGRAYIYFGSLNGLPATPSQILDDANQAGALYGVSVASAGDVNGDGFSDVIIGAYRYDFGIFSQNGRVFIHYGSPAGVSVTPDRELSSSFADDAFFGRSVAGAGDLNGDGYGDIIIGAYGESSGTGAAYIFYGSASGIGLGPDLILNGVSNNDIFGISVSSAGDVNGDGHSDVIIGAWGVDDGGNTNEGIAYVFLGSATGLSTSPDFILDDADLADAQFGVSVATAGDVNGDGFSDIVVGANNFTNNVTSEGRVFIYYGSPAGPSSTPDFVADDSDQNQSNYGYSVSSAGDINGDGYSDIIVGADGFDDGTPNNEGRSYVYLGSSTGLNTVPYTIDISGADASNFGHSAATAGDINGDGFSDIIIGAYNYDDAPFSNEGNAYIYYGNDSSGLRNNLRLYNSDLTTPIQQSNMNDPNLFGAGLYGKSFLGRQKGKLVWETVKNGNPFSGIPITNSTVFTTEQISFSDLGIAGTELKNQVAKIVPAKATYIRARIKYDPVTAITGQVYGPWRYPEGFLRGRRDLGSVVLPVKFLFFNAAKKEDRVLLQWATENETPGIYFEIQHRNENSSFTTLKTENGTGFGSAQYEWIHSNPGNGKNYYRIRAIQGNLATSTRIRQINFNNTGIKIYPTLVKSGDELIIEINDVFNQLLVAELIDLKGSMIFKTSIIRANHNKIRIPVLPPGQYYLRISKHSEILATRRIHILN